MLGLPTGPRCRPRGSLLSKPPLPSPRVPAPIATSDTIFELGFERALKKQNKEQVPPASAPPEQPHRRQHAGKSAKKPSANDATVKPGKCRSLEEALRAVSVHVPRVRRRDPRHSLTRRGERCGPGWRRFWWERSRWWSALGRVWGRPGRSASCSTSYSCLRQEAERREAAGREFLVSSFTHSLSAVWEES